MAESMNAIMNGGELLDLSAQQLVDCIKENDGCNGGGPNAARKYIAYNDIVSEKNYPYKA